MKCFSILFTLFVFSVSLIAQTATAPENGDGTLDNPYEIATLENLCWIAADDTVVTDPDQASRWSSHYIQIADIDASDTINWFDGQGWNAIGNQDQAEFSGTYDGNNHIIQGLFINQPSTGNIGFFGYTNNAAIANLGLEDVNISCSYHGGALVGLNRSSTVTNCYSTGILNGSTYVGGLVGNNFVFSTISDSYSSVDVNGYGSLGGVAGLNESFSIINNSYNTGNISGLSSSSSSIGGLVGWNLQSTVNNCYNLGEVIGAEYVGGLVGDNSLESSVSNSYSSGVVVGDSNVGGLVGRSNNSVVINSYYNAEISGQSDSGKGDPRTTAEMTFPYASDTYVDWDFAEIWSADEDYSQNDGYPYHSNTVVSAEDNLIPAIQQIALTNYPNPFNPETTIRYTLTENVKSMSMQIFNIRGQLIRTLISAAPHPKGEYQILWDGRNDYREPVSSGIYFCKIVTSDSETTNKMLLLR